MSGLTFIVNGVELTTGQIELMAQKKPRVQRAEKSFHKGWRVEGHPPGAMEDAKAQADSAIALFDRERELGITSGKRPVSWDENYWRNNHKKRPVRAKPYEVPEAAEICADIAKKEGWLDVVVVEIKKEKP
jgi:hypothetical protein